jgi:pimeloyl-ACP methyl ester carboxylesterase
MKKLICLHGNPLNGQEFEPLLKDLELLGFQAILHKRPIKGSQLESLLQSVNAVAKLAGGPPFTLMAYSWGAYLALAYLKRFPENVEGVLLINPLLAEHQSFSAWDKFILATPLLRTLVYRFRRKALIEAWLKQRFAPEEPLPELTSALRSYLSQTQIWRGEAIYTKLLFQQPLTPFKGIKVPVRALCGAEDQMTRRERQMSILDTLEHKHIEFIPSAGHALPWTHQEAILVELTRLSNQNARRS